MRQRINKGKNSIWRMEEKIKDEHIQDLVDFTSKHGPLIRELLEKASYNDNALRSIGKFVEQCRTKSTADRISAKLEKLRDENEPRKALASYFHELLNKLNSRIHAEKECTVQFSAHLKTLFGKILDVSSDVGPLEIQVLQLKDKIEKILLGEINSSVLHEVIQKVECSELCLKNARQKFKVIYAVMGSCKCILNAKLRYLCRVTGHQQYMKESFKKMNSKLGEICIDIEKILNVYHITVKAEGDSNDPNLHWKESLDAAGYAFENFMEHVLDLCFSWRTRLFHNRPILSDVRLQSGATCSYCATLSTVESGLKREHAAYPTILKDTIGQPDEFLVDLSRHQLEDIVEHFYATHKMKDNKRLNVCLEKMKTEGVVSEEAYEDPHVQGTQRYRIKEYEEISLEPEQLDLDNIMNMPVSNCRRRRLVERRKRKVAKKNISEVIMSHLLEGKVFIANFLVTTEYYRLLPHQIYRVPKRDAKYEVNKKGKPYSHCVVVVGFGIRNKQTYLIYQNSYGKTWGADGFGRIYVDSVKKLFTVAV